MLLALVLFATRTGERASAYRRALREPSPLRATPPDGLAPLLVAPLERGTDVRRRPAATLLGLAVEGAARIELDRADRIALVLADARRARTSTELEALRRLLPSGAPGERLGWAPLGGHELVRERIGALERLARDDAERLGFLARRHRPARILLGWLAVLASFAAPLLALALRHDDLGGLLEHGAWLGPVITALLAWRGAARRPVPTEQGMAALRQLDGIRRLAAADPARRDALLAAADRHRPAGTGNAAERLLPYALALETNRATGLMDAMIDAAERLRFRAPGPNGVVPPGWILSEDDRLPLRERAMRTVLLTRVALTGSLGTGAAAGGSGDGGAGAGGSDWSKDGRWIEDGDGGSDGGGGGDAGDGGGDGGGGDGGGGGGD